jgi:archaemetzincin
MGPRRRSGVAAVLCAYACAAGVGCRSSTGVHPAPPRDRGPPPGPPPAAFAFDPTLFAPKGRPRPGEWLAVSPETPQSFFGYVTEGPVRPTPQRHVIVLQPLGPFTAEDRQLLETLRAYLASFFQLEARVAAALPLPRAGFRLQDPDDPRSVQYQTGPLLDRVLAPRLPGDAVCYLGITMADLYPDPSWNYAFGMASLGKRVGVYSLARYGASFYGRAETPETRARFLRRALAVVAHETGHMFSLAHCTRYECVMNGANSLEELDGHPLWLCPACLRKLHWNLGFDLRRRYAELRAFYARHDLGDMTAWTDRVVARVWP